MIPSIVNQVEQNRQDILELKEWQAGTSPSRRFLHEEIHERFDDGELRALCYALGVNYDDLVDGGLSDKALDLVNYMGRHGRKRELLAELKRQRPKVDWSRY